MTATVTVIAGRALGGGGGGRGGGEGSVLSPRLSRPWPCRRRLRCPWRAFSSAAWRPWRAFSSAA